MGWANDWLDAGRDRAVGRTDKPVASGAVPEHVVRAAALASAALSVPLSFALGTGAGAAHLVVVASGWAYDLGLKRTVLSWVPYATAFGTLPAVVRLGVPPGEVPPSWLVVAGALLGVGAHVVNTLPDLDDDRATGVFSAPYRLGRKGSGVAAPLLLVLASALVVSGTGGGALGVVGLVVSAALAVVAVLAALRGVRGHHGARRGGHRAGRRRARRGERVRPHRVTPAPAQRQDSAGRERLLQTADRRPQARGGPDEHPHHHHPAADRPHRRPGRRLGAAARRRGPRAPLPGAGRVRRRRAGRRQRPRRRHGRDRAPRAGRAAGAARARHRPGDLSGPRAAHSAAPGSAAAVGE
nr:UbiA family prenyltransferase [Angustibacter aerolatus]